jgi:RNA polymerase sigma-70 factor (ECF subfamily)
MTKNSEKNMPNNQEEGSRMASIVESALAGDRASFEKLIALYEEKIFRMVFYRTGSHMDAEDLTQDIFMKAFKSLNTLKDKSLFRSWLFSIAVNRVRDFHKKKRFLVFFDHEEDMKDPDTSNMKTHDDPQEVNHMMRQEFWGHVRNFADKLSRWEREVFLLRFLDELTIKEIAQALSKSESAVKTHLYRAIKKFKENNALTRLLIGEIQ